MNINIAEMAGSMASRVHVGEEAMKLSRAKTHLELKKIKDELEASGEKVKVTEKDLEAVTRLQSEHIQEAVEEDRVTAEYSKFVYYSVQEFARVLQAAAKIVNTAEDSSVRLS
jgi:RNA-splicing ligase RtcB